VNSHKEFRYHEKGRALTILEAKYHEVKKPLASDLTIGTE